MKTLLLTVGGDDYEALMFKEYSVISAEDLAKMKYIDMDDETNIIKFKHKIIDDVEYEHNVPISLEVINGIIPLEFITYVRDEIQDYDSSKDKQFYIFEVE